MKYRLGIFYKGLKGYFFFIGFRHFFVFGVFVILDIILRLCFFSNRCGRVLVWKV